jgi:hypothetical protein
MPYFRVDCVDAEVWDWICGLVENPAHMLQSYQDAQKLLMQSTDTQRSQIEILDEQIETHRNELQDMRQQRKATQSTTLRSLLDADIERHALIIDELEGKFFSVKVVPSKLVTTKDEIDEQLAVYVEQGYEGQMLRDRNGAYEHKRSKSLLKHKEFIDEEVEILEVLEGVGNWAGYAKAVVIRRANGVVQQSGMRGTQDYAAYLLRIADRLKGTQATCRAQGETADGKLRFPVITFFWEGDRDL